MRSAEMKHPEALPRSCGSIDQNGLDPLRARTPVASRQNPDFIEVYPDRIDPEACQAICRRFDGSAHQPGCVGSGIFPELKNSRDLKISDYAEWATICEYMNQAVLLALISYIRTYPYLLLSPLLLQMHDPHSGAIKRLTAEDFASMDDDSMKRVTEQILRFGGINIQKYTANQGGYPYWHCEYYPQHTNADSLHRTLLWTLYLNDGFQAGETEFMYQQRKIVPHTGSILIAPTAFTHTHRGNQPRGGDKYIATSWILFQRGEHIFGDQG